eukprot:jgi/Mesvir1/1257/Mv25515-RA.1
MVSKKSKDREVLQNELRTPVKLRKCEALLLYVYQQGSLQSCIFQGKNNPTPIQGASHAVTMCLHFPRWLLHHGLCTAIQDIISIHKGNGRYEMNQQPPSHGWKVASSLLACAMNAKSKGTSIDLSMV